MNTLSQPAEAYTYIYTSVFMLRGIFYKLAWDVQTHRPSGGVAHYEPLAGPRGEHEFYTEVTERSLTDGGAGVSGERCFPSQPTIYVLTLQARQTCQSTQNNRR